MFEPNYVYKAKVTNVVDGDTVDVTIDVGFSVTTVQRLRLLRVNTYEMHDKDEALRSLAVAAKSFTSNAVLGKIVVIMTRKDDAFGRYLAEVYYGLGEDQLCLSDELLRNGLAVPYLRK